MKEEMNGFQVIQKSSSSAARKGLYTFSNSSRKAIPTPGFLAPTSRGVVPHLTPDNVNKLGSAVSGFTVAVEDFLDRLPKDVPFLNGENKKSLLCLPNELPFFLSPRRSSPVPISQPNTNDSISIMTSEGTKSMPLSVYFDFCNKFNPDVVVAPPDLPNLSPGGRPGGNRVKKMANRTEKWLDCALDCTANGREKDVFAAVLPGVPQREYLEHVGSKKEHIRGLTFWDTTDYVKTENVDDRHVTKRENTTWEQVEEMIVSNGLSELVKMYSVGCETPHDILQMVSQGIDLFQGDCCTQFTDSGIALDFTFPAPQDESTLGFNLWDDKYTTDMSVIYDHNNKAYLHHLLNAREMTSWVILQMHNMKIMSRFFEGIRSTIEHGTFEQEYDRFCQVYGDRDAARAFRDEFKDKATGPTTRGYAIGHLEQQLQKQAATGASNSKDASFRKL